MTFEIAISTMHKTIDDVFEMLEKENIHCDCIVINQCDINDSVTKKIGEHTIRIFCTTERGLSRSRNMALKNAQADILLIGDDDLKYYDDFDKTIINLYESNPNIDVGIFNIETYDRVFPKTEQRITYPIISHFTSVQISFKVSSVRKINIDFNINYGAGSGIILFGEENLFLSDCYKKGLQFKYFPQKILLNEDRGISSWFNGMNNKQYLRDKGVVYYALYKNFCFLYIIRFLLKHRNQIKPYSTFEAFKFILNGINYYKTLERGKNGTR